MKSFRNKAVSAATLLLAAQGMAPVHAADLAPMPDTSQWQFTVAPYGWGVAIKGDVGLFGRQTVEIDLPMSDVFDYLDFAGMGVAEAHNGTWGVFVDAFYADLSADESRSRVFSVDRDVLPPDISFPSIKGQLDASLGVQEFIGTLMGQWRAVDSDQMTLDLMAGARIWHVDVDASVKLKLSGTGPLELEVRKALSGTDGDTWVDPMVGMKTRIETGSPLYFTGWGMIGGAGVGSDITWDLMGGLGYQWTEKFSTVLGYRAIGVDYENDGFEWDLTQQGVVFGGVFSF
jgi:hypothetical protein